MKKIKCVYCNSEAYLTYCCVVCHYHEIHIKLSQYRVVETLQYVYVAGKKLGNESGNDGNDIEKCGNEARNNKAESYVVYAKEE